MTGIICLDKPENLTSFGAVSRLRRIIGEKKAGHAGTLDPFATGVLPVAFGGCTRFLELFESHDKTYIAAVKTGLTTDTLDITGAVLTTREAHISREAFLSVLENFRGDIKQLPPMYSALKKDGVRLYELARKGIEVEREYRSVSIYSLELVSADEEKGEFVIEVSCSAGTYIRSLAADIGDALGCGAALSSLRRTGALGFTEDDCVSFEQLEQLKQRGGLADVLIPIDKALGYERLAVTAAQAKRFHNGGELFAHRISASRQGRYCVYSPQGDFLGVGRLDTEAGCLFAEKVYVQGTQ